VDEARGHPLGSGFLPGARAGGAVSGSYPPPTSGESAEGLAIDNGRVALSVYDASVGPISPWGTTAIGSCLAFHVERVYPHPRGMIQIARGMRRTTAVRYISAGTAFGENVGAIGVVRLGPVRTRRLKGGTVWPGQLRTAALFERVRNAGTARFICRCAMFGRWRLSRVGQR
jgi:hypothetical protein